MWREIKRILFLIFILIINFSTMYHMIKILDNEKNKIPVIVLQLVYCFSCYALGRYEERYYGGKKC